MSRIPALQLASNPRVCICASLLKRTMITFVLDTYVSGFIDPEMIAITTEEFSAGPPSSIVTKSSYCSVSKVSKVS